MDPRISTFGAPQLAIIAGDKSPDLHGEDRRSAPPPRGRPTLAWQPGTSIAVAVGVAILAFVMWLITTPSSAGLVERLPPDERAALFQRTRDNLRDICRGPDRPRDFCREQAKLVLDFPECGEACAASARSELGADTAMK